MFIVKPDAQRLFEVWSLKYALRIKLPSASAGQRNQPPANRHVDYQNSAQRHVMFLWWWWWWWWWHFPYLRGIWEVFLWVFFFFGGGGGVDTNSTL